MHTVAVNPMKGVGELKIYTKALKLCQLGVMLEDFIVHYSDEFSVNN